MVNITEEARVRLVLLAVVSDRIFDEISIALSEASPNLRQEESTERFKSAPSGMSAQIAELLDLIVHLSRSYRDAWASVEELASGIAPMITAPEEYKDTFDPKRLERRLLALLSIQSLKLCKSKFTAPAWKSDSFLTAKTIEQLIAEQGISPIADVSIFAGVIPDEDIDEFVADIYKGRAA